MATRQRAALKPPVMTAQPAAQAGTSRQAPSRAGKRGVTFYLDEPAWKAMQVRAINDDTTIQEFMERIVMAALDASGKAQARKAAP